VGILLLFCSVWQVKRENPFKLAVLAGLVGYSSTVLAYIVAVLLDVFYVRAGWQAIPFEMLIVSFVLPFFALYGWFFCIVFVISIVVLQGIMQKLGID
jgi:hypothetical protein